MEGRRWGRSEEGGGGRGRGGERYILYKVSEGEGRAGRVRDVEGRRGEAGGEEEER